MTLPHSPDDLDTYTPGELAEISVTLSEEIADVEGRIANLQKYLKALRRIRDHDIPVVTSELAALARKAAGK